MNRRKAQTAGRWRTALQDVAVQVSADLLFLPRFVDVVAHQCSGHAKAATTAFAIFSRTPAARALQTLRLRRSFTRRRMTSPEYQFGI